MMRMLIADLSVAFSEALAECFCDKYAVTLCHDGQTALTQLCTSQQDILVLHLSLPVLDGLSVLSQLPVEKKPAIIIALSVSGSSYVHNCAASLGVDYILIAPTPVKVVAKTVELLVCASDEEALKRKLTNIMDELGFLCHRSAYQRTMLAILTYRKDPSQPLNKVVYPEVAIQCGAGSGQNVENAIRDAISQAWDCGDRAAWAQYFPNITMQPSNKQFIARMAILLNEKND